MSTGNSEKYVSRGVGLSRRSGPLCGHCGQCGAARSVWLFGGMTGQPQDALESSRTCPRARECPVIPPNSQTDLVAPQ